MILSTHAAVGAALASFMPSNPGAAFLIGFASHFALDAIPHWDYPIRSPSVNPKIGARMVFDRALLRDALTIGSDGLAGIILVLYLFGWSPGLWPIFLGAIGAMLPDPLQFLHTRMPYEPLRSLQRFHDWAHSDEVIKNPILGFGAQAAFVAVVFVASSAIHSGFFDSALAMVHGNG
jgi:hypothetical protein